MALNIGSFTYVTSNMLKKDSQPGLRTINPATGDVTIHPSLKIRVVKVSGAPYPKPDRVEMVQGKIVKAKMQCKDINALVKRLNDLARSSYRQVLSDPNWQAMYRCPGGTASIPYITPAASATTNTEEAYPCHNCGLVMPTRLVQIDHHHPQSGGSGMAVLKALRACGYTVGVAGGPKAGQLQSGVYAFIPPKGSPSGTFTHSTASSVLRYTLSDEGSIFLTVAAVANQVGALKSVCVNSVINLVPLCAYCNGSAGKGHGVKPVRP
ncbi:hypothetical protein [Ferrovibrio sp.]|uniref:hypothetical protein n=1 Tax=Ferrovibrio sp. TaxID=1917215 RepID=UPI00311DF09D